MNNANTEELGRIVVNGVSNFLSRPDQNNDNSARLLHKHEPLILRLVSWVVYVIKISFV